MTSATGFCGCLSVVVKFLRDSTTDAMVARNCRKLRPNSIKRNLLQRIPAKSGAKKEFVEASEGRARVWKGLCSQCAGVPCGGGRGECGIEKWHQSARIVGKKWLEELRKMGPLSKRSCSCNSPPLDAHPLRARRRLIQTRTWRGPSSRSVAARFCAYRAACLRRFASSSSSSSIFSLKLQRMRCSACRVWTIPFISACFDPHTHC